MKSLTIKPSHLSGRIHIPPSKSMSHRAIVCALLSDGQSLIDNIELSSDIIATCQAAEALGAEIDILQSDIPGRKKLLIRSNGAITIKKNIINCGESGTTARFIIPVSRLADGQVTITGEGKLVERPFDVYYKIFEAKGIHYKTDGGKLPLTIGGRLKPGCYELRGDVSSQFISGLLLALPLLPGDSTIVVTTPIESAAYIDITINMQKMFGIQIEFNKDENTFFIPGWQKYNAQNYAVEGDWSQAAFWLAAGALSGPVEICGLNRESVQGDRIIASYVKEMGAGLRWEDDLLVVEKNNLKGISKDVSQCPDLVPALAVLGSVAQGQTEILNAERLRIKECDRLKAIGTELRSLGAKICEGKDYLHIKGVGMLLGGRVYGWNDHRIVMAEAIAALACEKNVVIEGHDAVNKSYPSFWQHYCELGGKTCEQYLG